MHVLITTFTEPAETVKECVLRLIVAPEPVYMEKKIYVCDDGHSKSEGPKKRAMVDELRILGQFPFYLFFYKTSNFTVSGTRTLLTVL